MCTDAAGIISTGLNSIAEFLLFIMYLTLMVDLKADQMVAMVVDLKANHLVVL